MTKNENSDIIKLTNIKNKYLTRINDKAKMKSKLFSNNQSVAYTTQGELIINGKCLTQKQNDQVEFDKCDEKNLNIILLYFSNIAKSF